MKKDNTSRFDLIAQEWDSVPTRRDISQNTAEYILDKKLCSPDLKVLDFGSGTGLLAVSLHTHVEQIIALDSSKGMLDQLDKKIEQFNISNIQTEFLDIEKNTDSFVETHKNSFDLIVSSMVLHHIEDTKALFSLFKKITKPGAILALADLDKEDGSFHKDNKEAGVKHFGFDQNSLKKIIEDAGWESVKFDIVHTVDRDAENSVSKKYPIFICIAK